MSKVLGVASFFIDVPNGDAAIHLLYSTDGPQATKKVERAIMVDGGAQLDWHAEKCDQSVYRTIREIEDEYECQSEEIQGGTEPQTSRRKGLQFDAFVVTHWDHDHYQGLMWFLHQSMKESEHVGLSRAIYAPGNGPAIPLSTFYAPNWKSNYIEPKGGPSQFPWALLDFFRTPYDANDTKHFGNQLPSDACMAINIGSQSPKSAQDWYPNLLRMRIGTANLLGRNFFSREDPPPNVRNSPNLSTLLNHYDTWASMYPDIVGVADNAKIPGFFCVAANTNVIGGTSAKLLTVTNKSSICCLIAWKPTDYVSLFSAGDAHAALELAICDWLQFEDTDDKAATILKLSHHGSASSTPPILWPRLKPQHVVSMSSLLAGHAHPRWEVMHDMFGWMLYGDMPLHMSPNPLQLTKWPSMIGMETEYPDDPGRMNVDQMKTIVERLLFLHNATENARKSKDPFAGDLPRLYLLLQVDDALKEGERANPPYDAYLNKAQMRSIICDSLHYEVFPELAFEFGLLAYHYFTEFIAYQIVGSEDNVDYNKMSVKYVGNPYPVSHNSWTRLQWSFSNLGSPSPRRSVELNRLPRSSVSSTASWDLIDDDINTAKSNSVSFIQSAAQQSHPVVAEGDKTIEGSSVIPIKHPLHDFITRLPNRLILLESKPTLAGTLGSSHGSIQANLSDNDEWQTWMRLAMLLGKQGKSAWRKAGEEIDEEELQILLFDQVGQTNQETFSRTRMEPPRLRFEASEWPPTASTKVHFDIQVNTSLDDGSQVSTRFDTRQAPAALRLESSTLDIMLADTSTLPMGVTITKTPTTTWILGQVAELVQFPHSKAIDLLRDLPLMYIPPNEGRSALWFAAGSAHATTLRLEFVLTEQARTRFCGWLGADSFEFKITKVAVIARRELRYKYSNGRPPKEDKPGLRMSKERLQSKDTGLARGEIRFSVEMTIGAIPFSAHITISESAFKLRLQKDPGPPAESELVTMLKWAARVIGDEKGKRGGDDDEKYRNSSWSSCEMWFKSATDYLGAVRPRVFEFFLGYDQNGKLKGVDSASLTLEVDLKTGTPSSKDPAKTTVVFFVAFGWARAQGLSMRGKLWCAPRPGLRRNEFASGLPAWEKHLQLLPASPQSTIDHIDLKMLLGVDTLPAGIPTEVTKAEISIDSSSILFLGNLTCSQHGSNSKIPVLSIDSLQLFARRTWANPKTSAAASWQAGLEVDLFLQALDESPQAGKPPVRDPCRLRGSIMYSGGQKSESSWVLQASVEGLTVAHLAVFWEKGPIRDAAMVALSHLMVDYVRLDYRYGPCDGDGGSGFAIKGQISIAGMSLALEFHHKGEKGWEFSAQLRLKQEEDEDDDFQATVRTFLEGILGQGTPLPDVPGAVLDIPLGRPGDGEVLGFKCALVEGKKSDPKDDSKQIDAQLLVVNVTINIAKISLSMVQWRDTTWETVIPSKRVIKVSLNDLGAPRVPLVGELKQPFEELAYMWVSDKATEQLEAKPKRSKALAVRKREHITKSEDEATVTISNGCGIIKTKDPATLAAAKRIGITKAEMVLLGYALTGTSQLYFKNDSPDPEKVSLKEFVVEAGSHFVIVAKNSTGVMEAVLDYVFGRPQSRVKHVADNLHLAEDEIHSNDPAKAPFKKSAGPVSIENIGLIFDLKRQRLGIKLDATFLLGPIGLALLGFGLTVRLGEQKKGQPKVQGLPISNPEATLDGLLVSFDRPPLTIAGGFVRTQVKDATYYSGGLIVGFVPWKLMAVGVYGEVPISQPPSTHPRHRRGRASIVDMIELSDDDEELVEEDDAKPQPPPDKFTMVFIMIKLQGPLFSVGFADLSGLTAGVGINSYMRLPSAESVLEFPFTKPSGTPSLDKGPLAALTALLYPPSDQEPWFTPRQGSMWIAAGVTATAFSLLSVDAVVVVQMNPDIQLGIFGVAVVDVPSLLAPVKFAHVELGIACVLDLGAGTFRFDAQLSPRSYILHENCHLTGGMAMYAWFEPLSSKSVQSPDRPSNGEWVITIGGFHQAFVRPGAYPNPPRLGIAWSLSDYLKVTGEAYFALTPRICMGGGRIHAALSVGPLTAWFDAFLDFLINFRPFKFAADGRLAVGIRYSMDLWLVTIRINAEIGALLSVIGPPIAGRVHVDFWVFGFDVDFGDRDRAIRENNAGTLSLLDFVELVLKGAGKSSSILEGDWIHLQAKKDQTSTPFLFNCTGGMLSDNEVLKEKTLKWTRAMFDEDVPKSTWIVKAGEFAFSLDCSFAVSKAVFCDNRPSRPSTIDPTIQVPIKEEYTKAVFGLPMRLTQSIESTVTISVTQEEKHIIRLYDDVSEPRSKKKWSVKPIVKALPQAIWGAYDPETDPSLHGNAVSALLNPPAGAKGTVNLVTGFEILPPLAYISDDVLKKFNIVEDMRLSVNTQGYPFVGVKKRSNPRWKPRLPPTEKKERWQVVKDTWDTQAVEARAQAVVQLWSELLRWDQNKEQNRALTGKRPTALLRRFENMVPAPPMITVGVV